MPQTLDQDTTEIVDRYVAVWSEPDARARRTAVTALWAADGAEFVEGAVHRGHDALEERIAEAYQAFVAGQGYSVTAAADTARHDDIVTLTIQLTTPTGHLAWAARVFLLLDAHGLIREDYQLTVKPLTDDA